MRRLPRKLVTDFCMYEVLVVGAGYRAKRIKHALGTHDEPPSLENGMTFIVSHAQIASVHARAVQVITNNKGNELWTNPASARLGPPEAGLST